ncbi:MAG: helix-turn-helix domain-containing protein [Spirochaetia bacterium]|nr:helix-turn-helix domain-containing protein [Spirochaetia bacterium]
MLNEKQRKQIRKKMIDRDITITNLAKELDVSRQYISGILGGILGNPRVEKLLMDWKNKKEN